MSPDKKTLLILTSGYNEWTFKNGKPAVEAVSRSSSSSTTSSGAMPIKRQVLRVPNTFAGIAFSPDGKSFHVAGGKDDNLHSFTLQGAQWAESGEPVALGHKCGLGFYCEYPVAAGVDVTADGDFAVVANLYNNSLSVVDLRKRQVAREIQLRPGLLSKADTGARRAASTRSGSWSRARRPPTSRACATARSTSCRSPARRASPPGSR